MDAGALQAARTTLRATATVVTHRDGHRTLERDGEAVEALPPPDVLPPALRPEPKRLCIEPPSMPTWELPSFEGWTLPPIGEDLSLVTWNVWFAPQEADARMAALFSEALAAAPDVLLLQEVVPELAASVRASAALCAAYAVSPNPIDEDAYGCLLLARHALKPSFREVDFPSRMGRSLVLAELTPPGAAAPLAVATVHLESLDSAPTRAKQLRVAYDALGGYEAAALAGDFNFDATRNFGEWRELPPQPSRPTRDADSDDDDDAPPYAGPVKQSSGAPLENAVLAERLPGYVDAWPAVRGVADLGHTFDGATNPHVRDADECMRYDRVMLRNLRPRSVRLLGVRRAAAAEGEAAAAGTSGGEAGVAAEGGGGLVPSDHYGVHAVIAWP